MPLLYWCQVSPLGSPTPGGQRAPCRGALTKSPLCQLRDATGTLPLSGFCIKWGGFMFSPFLQQGNSTASRCLSHQQGTHLQAPGPCSRYVHTLLSSLPAGDSSGLKEADLWCARSPCHRGGDNGEAFIHLSLLLYHKLPGGSWADPRYHWDHFLL